MERPFYWRGRKGWYVKVSGANGRRRNVRLGDTKKAAYAAWREMQPVPSERLSAVFAAYLEWAEGQVEAGALKRKTVYNYGWYLVRLIDEAGDRDCADLRPIDVTRWMAGHKWGASGQRHAITAIKRALNWAVKQGLIAANPVAHLERPAARRRETLVTSEVHRRLMLHARNGRNNGKIDRQFQLILAAVRHCGGRPGDVARVRVEDVDLEVTRWTLADHKTRHKTGKPRVVYLSPCLRTITRMAAGDRTSGPLFRNRRGAVTTNAISNRIKRLRDDLDLDKSLVLYSYRHAFITNALSRGVPVATVAELTGTSVAMIERHYGHLARDHAHLRAAAAQAMERR